MTFPSSVDTQKQIARLTDLMRREPTDDQCDQFMTSCGELLNGKTNDFYQSEVGSAFAYLRCVKLSETYPVYFTFSYRDGGRQVLLCKQLGRSSRVGYFGVDSWQDILSRRNQICREWIDKNSEKADESRRFFGKSAGMVIRPSHSLDDAIVELLVSTVGLPDDKRRAVLRTFLERSET